MAMARAPFISRRIGHDAPHPLCAPAHLRPLAIWRWWAHAAVSGSAYDAAADRPTEADATAAGAVDELPVAPPLAPSSAQAGRDAAAHDTTPDPVGGDRIVSGECEAFIRQHERAILNYLWRVVGDEQTAYDLTQEVFLRAWQQFAVVRRYEQPRSWLFRVATNLAITHLRRRALPVGAAISLNAAFTTTRDAIHDTSRGALRDPGASDPAARFAERDLVRLTLLQLTPRRRAALVLREVYGLSAAEVGQALGMTATAVRMALHRAREQFRAVYLRENDDTPPPTAPNGTVRSAAAMPPAQPLPTITRTAARIAREGNDANGR